jgi:hypothetical protein
MTPGYFLVQDIHQSWIVLFPHMIYDLVRCKKDGTPLGNYIHPISAEYIDERISKGEAEQLSLSKGMLDPRAKASAGPKFKFGDWLDWDTGRSGIASPDPLRVIAVERDEVQGRWRYRLEGVDFPVYEEALSLTEKVVCPTPAERRAAITEGRE